MNKEVVKLKNGDFKVINSSYDIPIKYEYNDKLQSGLERRRGSINSTRYNKQYGFYRNNGD